MSSGGKDVGFYEQHDAFFHVLIRFRISAFQYSQYSCIEGVSVDFSPYQCETVFSNCINYETVNCCCKQCSLCSPLGCIHAYTQLYALFGRSSSESYAELHLFWCTKLELCNACSSLWDSLFIINNVSTPRITSSPQLGYSLRKDSTKVIDLFFFCYMSKHIIQCIIMKILLGTDSVMLSKVVQDCML